MRAGLLKDEITLYPPGDTDPGEWGKVALGDGVTVAAAICDIKEQDRPAGGAVLAVAEVRATIRYLANSPSTDWMAEANGTLYGVVGVESDRRHTWHRLFLKRR